MCLLLGLLMLLLGPLLLPKMSRQRKSRLGSDALTKSNFSDFKKESLTAYYLQAVQ